MMAGLPLNLPDALAVNEVGSTNVFSFFHGDHFLSPGMLKMCSWGMPQHTGCRHVGRFYVITVMIKWVTFSVSLIGPGKCLRVSTYVKVPKPSASLCKSRERSVHYPAIRWGRVGLSKVPENSFCIYYTKYYGNTTRNM